MRTAKLALVVLVLSSSAAYTQLTVAKDGPVVYGHHHINTMNLAAHKRFFVETLGGTLITVGTNNREIVEFPNVLVFFNQAAPTGGNRGTTVNHVGFSVPDLRPLVAKIKANGFEMITKTEAPPDRKVENDIALPAAPGGNSIALALGPDDLKIEIVEVKTQTIPISLHHIHFFGQQNIDMQAWYGKTFGGDVRTGGAFPQVVLPGVALNFSPSPTPVVGTQGRVIDHVGFEIENLEAFTKKLEAAGIKLERPYTRSEALGIALAFIKDPWGTYIEMTEGLDKIN